MMQVDPVERDRALEAVGQHGRRAPPQRCADSGRVGVTAPDIYRLFLRRPVDVAESTGAGRPDEQRDEVAMRDRFEPAHVERLSVARVRRSRAQKRVCRVVDVHEVAELGAVTVDLNLAVLDCKPDEPGDEALAIVLHRLSWTVYVREPQRTGTDAKDVVVDEVVILACGLVDAVHVGRSHEMILGLGLSIGTRVYLTRARILLLNT